MKWQRILDVGFQTTLSFSLSLCACWFWVRYVGVSWQIALLGGILYEICYQRAVRVVDSR